MNTIQTVRGHERINYSTKETAQFIREALKKAFPGVKFSVRTSYGSMTSSTSIRWTDGPTIPEVDAVVDRFSSKTFNGSDDSTHYHEQELNGQRVQFSGWIHTSRDTSAALLQKALDRYNFQRAEYGFGPAALEVVVNAYGSAHLAGPDQSKANPCGGTATWCLDAVYALAYHMRPNGVRVILKSDIR